MQPDDQYARIRLFNRRKCALSIIFRCLIVSAFLGAAVGCTIGDGPEPSPNLLQPDFVDEHGKRTRHWVLINHANPGSYILDFEDNAVRMERVGPEPWARLQQNLSGQHIEAAGGQWVAFSAELKGHLDNSEHPDFSGESGLHVQLVSKPPEDLRARSQGIKNTEEHTLGIPVVADIPDWQQHVLEFYLPEDIRRIEASLIMASGGWLKMRNPALRVIDE